MNDYKTDQDDFDFITTTYGEHQKQILDESQLYEHREHIYDAESDITPEVDEQNNETLNTRQLPDNNIRSYIHYKYKT